MIVAYASGGKGKSRDVNSVINDLASRAVSEDWRESRFASEMDRAFRGMPSNLQKRYRLQTRMTTHRIAGDI